MDKEKQSQTSILPYMMATWAIIVEAEYPQLEPMSGIRHGLGCGLLFYICGKPIKIWWLIKATFLTKGSYKFRQILMSHFHVNAVSYETTSASHGELPRKLQGKICRPFYHHTWKEVIVCLDVLFLWLCTIAFCMYCPFHI